MLSVYPSIYRVIYLSSIYLSIFYVPRYLSIHLLYIDRSDYPCIYLFTYLSIHASIYLSIYLSMPLFFPNSCIGWSRRWGTCSSWRARKARDRSCRSIFLSVYPCSIYLAIYLSVYHPTISLSADLSCIYQHIYLFMHLSIYLAGGGERVYRGVPGGHETDARQDGGVPRRVGGALSQGTGVPRS